MSLILLYREDCTQKRMSSVYEKVDREYFLHRIYDLSEHRKVYLLVQNWDSAIV